MATLAVQTRKPSIRLPLLVSPVLRGLSVIQSPELSLFVRQGSIWIRRRHLARAKSVQRVKFALMVSTDPTWRLAQSQAPRTMSR